MNAQLPAARQGKALEARRTPDGGFDIDLYHVMEGSDDALIADEVLHGSMSGAFVYSFSLQGSTVAGISVIGAAHLARHYGGIKHRMIASVEKRGSLFRFTSYPADGQPMQVTTSTLYDLEADPDFYTVVIEVQDIKSGNSIQVEKTELRMEKKRDGGQFERPHYQVIAQSKAYRNAILRLVPQDVQGKFKQQCLEMGKSKDISTSAIDQKRNGVLTYAAKNSLPINRDAVGALTWAQISGLSDAARESLAAFTNAAKALGLVQFDADGVVDEQPATAQIEHKQAVNITPAAKAEPATVQQQARPARQQRPAPQPEPEPPAYDDGAPPPDDDFSGDHPAPTPVNATGRGGARRPAPTALDFGAQ